METRSRSREAKRKKMEMLFLPPELIREIFLRLPVKSLVRFKIACKLWLSLISDPQFAKSHFDIAAARTERVFLLACDDDGDDEGVLSLDFNASLRDDSAVIPLMPQIPYFCETIRILGSCRGFLLFEMAHLWHLLVWNPSTGDHITVPYSPIKCSTNNDSMYNVFMFGFGYDPSIDDYLIVQVLYCLDGEGPNRVEFFSIKANSWKEIEDVRMPYSELQGEKIDFDVGGTHLNNALHWFAIHWNEAIEGVEEEDIEEEMNVIILAFDLTEKSLSEVPLPVDFEYDEDQLNVLRVLGELLSLCAVVGENQSIQVSVMKEYKVQSSWMKTILVSFDNIPPQAFWTNRIILDIICSTKNGDIVGHDGHHGLVKFNDEGQLQEHQNYLKGLEGFCVAVYTESLLTLPLTTSKLPLTKAKLKKRII